MNKTIFAVNLEEYSGIYLPNATLPMDYLDYFQKYAEHSLIVMDEDTYDKFPYKHMKEPIAVFTENDNVTADLKIPSYISLKRINKYLSRYYNTKADLDILFIGTPQFLEEVLLELDGYDEISVVGLEYWEEETEDAESLFTALDDYAYTCDIQDLANIASVRTFKPNFG